MEGESAWPATKGWNNGSRNPRRVLEAPWMRISLMVMGLDDWSTICVGVSRGFLCHNHQQSHQLRYPALLGHVLFMFDVGFRLGFLE